MKKLLALLMACFVMLCVSNAYAYTPPPPPANGGYVVDLAGKLDASQIDVLNKRIDQISKSTKNEMGALILPSMEGASIEEVAQSTFDSWKLGKKGLDNGVLVVISVAERKSRIQTGAGVEGDLTDLQSKTILKEKLAPHLKNGDFFSGLDATFSAISSTLESRAKEQAATSPNTSTPSSKTGGALTYIIIGSIFLAIILGWVITSRRRRFSPSSRVSKYSRDKLIPESKWTEGNVYDLPRYTSSVRKTQTPAPVPVIKPFEPVKPVSSPKPVSPISPRKELPSTPRNASPRINPGLALTTLGVAAAGAGAVALSSMKEKEDRQLRQKREEQERYERERRSREEREARERQERQEREEREERDRRSRRDSWSAPVVISTPSWSDSGSSSSGGSDGGFGGFGGGDSGGGGASSDW